MKNDRKFRHELKYLINKREMDCCITRLERFAKLDLHATGGRYFVRSLYYDDMNSTAYDDKESGVAQRRKFRIRNYNLDRRFISLENKIKQGAYVRKESSYLSEDEYGMIMKGETDFLLARDESAANDFGASYCADLLRPVAFVDYDRIPYVYEPGDVRITFDMNICAAQPHYDIFASDLPSYRVLDGDLLIMEVKYTDFLPEIFVALLPDNSCRVAASKFVMCIDRLIEYGLIVAY